MSDNERVERLARLLEDHECWEHPGWCNGHWPENRKATIADFLMFGTQVRACDCYLALDAAISEVDSGRVFGAPDRCAICGRPEATHWTASFYHPHYACHRSDNPECADAWSKAYEDSPSDNGPDETIRTILRARKILRQRKAKQSAAPTSVVCGCCGERAEPATDADVYWCRSCGAAVDRLAVVHCAPGFVPDWKPKKPAPNPVREWGMEWPGKAGVLGSPHEYQPETLRRWRDRLRAGKIRAEVPERKPSVAFREAVNRGTKAPPPWPFPCYPVTGEPVSGNPRGDGFLRDLWREDEKRTEVLRRIQCVEERLSIDFESHLIAIVELDKNVRAVRELVRRTAADLLAHVQASKPKDKPRARKGGKR